MGPKRIVRASMTTALVVLSITIAEGRHSTREPVQRPDHGGTASPAAAVRASAFENNAKLQQTPGVLEASQGGFDISTRNKRALVGSWLDTVTVTGGPTFRSLATYADDGVLTGDDQGSVVTAPPFPNVGSTHHGVWVHQDGRTFSTTFLSMISDLNGNLVYLNKVRETITMSKSGNAYHGVWKGELSNPAGTLVIPYEGTVASRRIQVEPLP